MLVTGHTGFKGAWLSEWLLQAGAAVSGLALPPEYAHSVFAAVDLEHRLEHVVCDIRDSARVNEVVARIQPEFVFHLAAQPLVRRSYREPLETWATNVLGTLNLLEALRATGREVVVVVVTTDKVYRNREWEFAYREVDELGGHDPYSASKAACEVAVASWRASYGDTGVRVATARAGNVLGGGDQSEDRIVPDCYRAWKNGRGVVLRHAGSTRPWQHVLEPLSGYLALAQHLSAAARPMDACNFGPGPSGDRTVRELVTELASMGSDRAWSVEANAAGPHEARALALVIDRARHELGWAPALSFEETARWVDEGYVADHDALADVVRRQISLYEGRMQA